MSESVDPDISSRVEYIDDQLCLLGTAHVSATSIDDVKHLIKSFQPDIVALELDAGRLDELTSGRRLDEESLAKVIKEGRAPLVLAQCLLSSQQRKVAEKTQQMPGGELLAAHDAAKATGLRVELVDRDVQVTLKRAWSRMKIREKWRLMRMALFEEEEEIEADDVEAMLTDRDLLTQMIEEVREIVPTASEVLVDERDTYLAARIEALRTNNRVLAVIGAGHLDGVSKRLSEGAGLSDEELRGLELIQKGPPILKTVGFALPLAILGIFAWLVWQGDWATLADGLTVWIAANAFLSALGAIIARGHPATILAAAIASPFTSLNPMLAAGWVAGYVQLKVDGPSAHDLQTFLRLEEVSSFWSNRAGRVLLVTALVNVGSIIGTWLGAGGLLAAL